MLSIAGQLQSFGGLKSALELAVMRTICTLPLALLIGVVTASGQTNARAGGDPSASNNTRHPRLFNVCLVTEDVRRLVDFYEPVFQRKADWSGSEYADFAAGGAVLAIFSAAAQEKYIPGSAKAAKNHSVILEFQVADADEEYRRLQGIVKNWVKPPTTQPWGTRSIYFRDPDGNLIDFFDRPAKAR
jgi:uncharacterized glyoxalase superfamily protein PhnB